MNVVENITQTIDGSYRANIDGLTWIIPVDPGNRHFQMVQDAIAIGASVTIEEPPAPPAPDPKLVGVEFEGVMCSATDADQAGLAAVLVAIQFQGANFKPTKFYFENGNTLVLSLDNYQAFAATWLPFRQSFFTPEG